MSIVELGVSSAPATLAVADVDNMSADFTVDTHDSGEWSSPPASSQASAAAPRASPS